MCNTSVIITLMMEAVRTSETSVYSKETVILTLKLPEPFLTWKVVQFIAKVILFLCRNMAIKQLLKVLPLVGTIVWPSAIC
jgi:hypothetical protein